jgi:organic hydroperoxide reductase OsmC/OhrA
MNRLEKVLYTAKAHSTGGRAGMSRSSDGRLEVRLSRPAGPRASIRRWSLPRAT